MLHPTPEPPPTAPAPPDGGALLLACFNGVRAELVGTLVVLLGNRDDALDAAQDAFLKCWKRRDALGGIANLRAWVFAVALNAARDLRRSGKSRRTCSLPGEDAMPAATTDAPPSAALERAEAVGRLREAIQQLRAEEQEIFLLRQNGDLTYEEIAAMRAMPVGTVKTQMRSAVLKLRAALAPDND